MSYLTPRQQAQIALNHLSRAQYEVLRLACYGLSIPDIARILQLHEATCHSHKSRGFKALGVRSIAQVAVLFTLAEQVSTWSFTPPPLSPPTHEVPMKSCPFCNSYHIELRYDETQSTYFQTCVSCDARGPSLYAGPLVTPGLTAETLYRWNQRETEGALL